METVNVVAAVICDSLQRKKSIFATARGYGEFKGLWEFPGGKIEPNETPHQALLREIKEELETQIRIGNHIAQSAIPNISKCQIGTLKKTDFFPLT